MATKAAKVADKAAAEPKKERGLSPNTVKVLTVLKKHPKGLTRSELSEKTEINKGWAKLLGAPTKGAEGGLEGAGFVSSEKDEEKKGFVYKVTSKGLKALEAHNKG
jgi:DNA-binding MarR family transcriptional regulator